jgi:hypothetical protein
VIGILTSGVALGVHVPGLLLRQRLAERGVPSEVFVLEASWDQRDRDRLGRSRDAFQRDFRVAIATQRLMRRHDVLIGEDARESLYAAWEKAGIDRLVVFSGFWLPLAAEFRGRQEASGTDIRVDACHLDAVDSPSFAAAEAALERREIRLLEHASGTVRWTIPVDAREPVAWEERERLFAHGGGWSMGTYRDAAGDLTAAGFGLDVVLGSSDADSPLLAAHDVRCFRIDPAWNAWSDPGFPPLRPVGAAAARIEADGWRTGGTGSCHPSFELMRRARAAVSKPGGGSLLDALWSATPVLLLDPFGRHESLNAELWLDLGLGLRFAHWWAAGCPQAPLLAAHRRALELRAEPADYAAELAGARA